MLKLVLKKFKKDQEGATALEFALISPLFFLLLFGLIELSVAMFVNTVVEGGLRDASRIGLRRMDTGALSREQRIADIVNDA